MQEETVRHMIPAQWYDVQFMADIQVYIGLIGLQLYLTLLKLRL